jgi:CO/xanthine dehydrogenase Mo-binding subunit
VSIDVETGMVRVERLVSAFDMGRAVNPRLCEVQIEGGVAMAIGSTLLEKMVMENGRTLNPNFTDYVVPTAKDVPDLQDQETFLVEALHKDGPFGAKGLGEATMIPVAPAIANAVYNAVGLRFKDLPLEPHRILDLLSKRERFGSEPA